MRHLTSVRQFGKQARTSALFHLAGKLPHAFLRDDATFATRQGCSGIFERYKKFRSLAFPFFPEGKRFLHRVLFGVEPSAFNGSAGKRFLVGGKLYVHTSQDTGKLAYNRRQKKYESPHNTPVPAAQPHFSGPSPTATCPISAEASVMAKPA